jgi:bifunctional DNA-binding transcriptional regulator/antitoxin component of YhaV-PrlF toxin-antitoxin module
MKRRHVTVTSKNQITLPADLVRKYKLDEHRVLEVNEKNGSLVLSPAPTLDETLATIHELTRPYLGDKPVLSDEELKQAIRQTAAERGDT